MNLISKYWQQLNIKATELIGVAVGAFIYSMTYQYLLLPSHLGEGGAMGITALLYYAFGVPSYLSNLLINVVLIAIGYKLFEKKTTYLTIWAIAWMTVFLKIPVFYHYHTTQVIVPTLLAGALTGISIGLIFRYNGTIAGDTIIGKNFELFLWHLSWYRELDFRFVYCIPVYYADWFYQHGFDSHLSVRLFNLHQPVLGKYRRKESGIGSFTEVSADCGDNFKRTESGNDHF